MLSCAPCDPLLVALIRRIFWWNDAKDGLWPMLTKVTPASAINLYRCSSLSMSRALVASSINTSFGLLNRILQGTLSPLFVCPSPSYSPKGKTGLVFTIGFMTLRGMTADTVG